MLPIYNEYVLSQINTATLQKFGKRWCKNSLINICQYAKCEGIGIFRDKAPDDLPFLIVGAGPSVKSDAEYLLIKIEKSFFKISAN